jgi:hypothetical protein
MNLQEIFEEYNDEYLSFEKVENKRSQRPDLHAFLLLDELFPSDRDIVSAAEHDEIYLDIEEDQLEKLTKEQILELVRCGIIFDSEYGCLCSFV